MCCYVKVESCCQSRDFAGCSDSIVVQSVLVCILCFFESGGFWSQGNWVHGASAAVLFMGYIYVLHL